MTDTNYYPKTNSEIKFTEIEKEILDFWKRDKTFDKSIDQNTNGDFVFYDGPPFANGLPHYGHLLTGFIKDAFARYQTMLGKRVERRFGWDCHGLPAEMGAEKELGVSGHLAIEKFGITQFNDHCRKSVMKFSSDWQDYVLRQGRWVDFISDYKTMDTSFMESVLWVFKRLYDKGLIYQSMRVMPYSWACETPLSHFETKMDNSYRSKTSKAITVAFTLKLPISSLGDRVCKLLAWTTTPWTLPSNLVLAISKNIQYGAVLIPSGEYYIASRSYLEANYQSNEIISVVYNDLIGASYNALFDYFADNRNSFKVLNADFVVEGEGTGVVHIAPGFGEDDFELCAKYDVPIVCPVDDSGCFTSEVPEFQGVQVFEANDEIIKILKQQGNWIKTEQYIHNYPHCWRTDTPLIYKAISSWYVKVTDIKERMVELNETINWVPHHIRDGQFGKWLKGARDWSISRNRFWGAPIPIWQSDDPKYPRVDVYGSISELERDFNVAVKDLHRPYIDHLVRPNPDDPTGKSMMRRVPDVLDCWFESGSMPYAQVHYPFENKDWFENNFPADFITEYVSQTRGWFYTLLILSTALFDRAPFKNCVCHGVVLDTKGQKLSKRLNNYVDPKAIFDKYGADALRFFMLSSPVVTGGDLLLDKEGDMIRDTLRLVMKPIWNAYHFFAMYANADHIQAQYDLTSTNLIDRYIIAKCHQAIEGMRLHFDNYNTILACKRLVDFFDALNNWYIRRSRDRFWQSGYTSDKQYAYNTLYVVFSLICRAGAPLLPFLMEKVWFGLGNKTSVHLQGFPGIEREYNKQLIFEMDKVREICNSALAIRNKRNIRIRQPLQNMVIYGENILAMNNSHNIDLIKSELNTKNVKFSNNISKVANYELKLNFSVLGKRLPTKIKEIMRLVKEGAWKELEGKQIKVGDFVLLPEEACVCLNSDHDNVAVLSTNDIAVWVDVTITHDLEVEGNARDLIRMIQQARKESKLEITDCIELEVKTSSQKYQDAIKTWLNTIKKETLSQNITIGEISEGYIIYSGNSEIKLGLKKV